VELNREADWNSGDRGVSKMQNLKSKLHDFFENRCINFMRRNYNNLERTTYLQDMYLKMIAYFEWKLR
jgi:hypothetical protein